MTFAIAKPCSARRARISETVVWFKLIELGKPNIILPTRPVLRICYQVCHIQGMFVIAVAFAHVDPLRMKGAALFHFVRACMGHKREGRYCCMYLFLRSDSLTHVLLGSTNPNGSSFTGELACRWHRFQHEGIRWSVPVLSKSQGKRSASTFLKLLINANFL